MCCVNINILVDIFFFCLFGAAPETYGGSQARVQIGGVDAGICHSHSYARSKLHLQPIPQTHGNTGSLTC